MKKFYLFLLLSFVQINLFAEDIVLRYWTDADKENLSSFSHTSFPYDWQFQRFNLDRPCRVKSMSIYLVGAPTNVTVCLIGHQGGSPLPFLFLYTAKDVLGTVQFQFPGSQSLAKIDLPLQNPIDYTNDQIFVGVNISNPDATFFITTLTELPPTCDSEDGGTFGFQSLANSKATQSADIWGIAKYTYMCDLGIEYIGDQYGYFSDRTLPSGLLPSMPNNTVAWGDIDSDGNLDLLVTGNLYQYKPTTNYKNITTKAGLTGTPMANAFIDIDNDGDQDILFLNASPAKCRIYINDGFGNFTGQDLSLPGLYNVSGFSIADVDNDHYPDIFVSQSWSTYPSALPNYFLLNNQKGSFTLKGGLATTSTPHRSRGCAFVDFDNDGDQDLFVSNYYQEQDELWENKGNLTFVNVAGNKQIDIFNYDGKSYANYGNGVDWYDFDNDEDMDLLVPQYAPPSNIALGFQGTTLYRNNNANFTNTWNTTDLKSGLGIAYEETHSGGAFGDIDNDGLVDLLLTASNGCRFIDLYKHNYDHTFSNITFEWGLNKIVTGDDLCWADYDNDGKLDLAFSQDRKFKLFKNTYSSQNNWLELDLTTENANYFAIGAKVKIFVPGKIYTQEVTAGRGKNMQKPGRLHFGLGSAEDIEDVQIKWPGAKDYVSYYNLKINQVNKIHDKYVSVEDLEQYSENTFLRIIGPNPSTSNLAAEFGISKNNSDTDISIFDLQGNRLETIVSDKYSQGTYKLDINTLKFSPGSYFLRLTANGKSEIKSFVIQR